MYGLYTKAFQAINNMQQYFIYEEIDETTSNSIHTKTEIYEQIVQRDTRKVGGK